MDAKAWSDVTGVPLPQCKMQGCCCRAASPSKPFHQLLQKAAQGDSFARDFFSIFIPHLSHALAEQAVPGIVARTQKAAAKERDFTGDDDLVFYHCRYLGEDNRCQVWEDRSELCHAHPDTPFVVLAPGCAFEPWAAAVKEKYQDIKAELSRLKMVQADLKQTHPKNAWEVVSDETQLFNQSMVMSLLPLYLVSPVISSLK